MTRFGFAEGTCPKCGTTIRRRRPTDLAVCDCYRFCPLCGEEMTPYNPDLAPTTYGPINSETATGDLDRPVNILYYCSSCQYYSAQKPLEVRLT